MKEAAFWAAGGLLAFAAWWGIPSVVHAHFEWRELGLFAMWLLAPALLGGIVCVLSSGLLVWGSWILSVPATLLGSAIGGFLHGPFHETFSLAGIYSTWVFFGLPLILLVVTSRLGWCVTSHLVTRFARRINVDHGAELPR